MDDSEPILSSIVSHQVCELINSEGEGLLPQIVSEVVFSDVPHVVLPNVSSTKHMFIKHWNLHGTYSIYNAWIDNPLS